MKSSAVIALAAALFATPALADCAGSHAQDRCLIGTWHFASGGSAEWMSRNIHMAHVTSVTHNDLAITFRPDGTFSTGHVDVHATVEANNGAVSGTGHSSGQAGGTWSAAGGHYALCVAPSSLHTTITIVVHGRPITVNAPIAGPPQPMAYTCDLTSMTTTQPIRGHEPIVTRYSRGH